jgi:hypothetical protein
MPAPIRRRMTPSIAAKPENLQPKMAELNAAAPDVRQVPTLDQVKSWVAEAKTLPRQVSC